MSELVLVESGETGVSKDTFDKARRPHCNEGKKSIGVGHARVIAC